MSRLMITVYKIRLSRVDSKEVIIVFDLFLGNRGYILILLLFNNGQIRTNY